MKNRIFLILATLSLTFLMFASICPGQNPPQPAPNQAEIMGEDDRLPFMQNEQRAAAEEPGSGGLLLKTLGAMLVVVGLIFGGAWGAKQLGLGNFKAGNSADEVNLAILTSLSLGSSRTISTVRFGDRVLLVGSTAQSFTLLAEETSSEKSYVSNSRSVAEMLNDEIIPFEIEFEKAQTRLNLDDGERI